MRNERGQALVEFLMVAPILFFILMAIFDFGNILYHQYKLENQLDFIADLYADEKTTELDEYLKENGLTMTLDRENEYDVLFVKSEVSVFTPGLSSLLGNPYKIHTTKVLYGEQYE